ncbi:lactose-binding lectin l-2-like [Gadus macrocephalus]|uniref:lactose-binding lectin l-2-like n=1 Tax=Gadus macrocephalus TaxID=80720 RepID=UPI0028CB8C01|nr:lactose-binding lectin l-2-like [Gadus macrocephalus]
MFLRSVLLCGLHALALAGLLTEPSADSKVKLERGSCPSFWYEFDTDCYKYVASLLTWADAELYCQSLGANLVSIHSTSEMIFIVRLIQNFDPTKGNHWIGLSDVHKEGSWIWSDGSPVDAAFWTEPNNHKGAEDCVHMTYWK